jgi:hypothetical protein
VRLDPDFTTACTFPFAVAKKSLPATFEIEENKLRSAINKHCQRPEVDCAAEEHDVAKCLTGVCKPAYSDIYEIIKQNDLKRFREVVDLVAVDYFLARTVVLDGFHQALPLIAERGFDLRKAFYNESIKQQEPETKDKYWYFKAGKDQPKLHLFIVNFRAETERRQRDRDCCNQPARRTRPCPAAPGPLRPPGHY